MTIVVNLALNYRLSPLRAVKTTWNHWHPIIKLISLTCSNSCIIVQIQITRPSSTLWLWTFSAASKREQDPDCLQNERSVKYHSIPADLWCVMFFNETSHSHQSTLLSSTHTGRQRKSDRVRLSTPKQRALTFVCVCVGIAHRWHQAHQDQVHTKNRNWK